MTWRGEDKFGKIAVSEVDDGKGCDACGSDRLVAVKWSNLQLPEGIDVTDKRLILPSKRAKLGITCGCYAKFHRQVVHIEEGMKRRELVAPKSVE